MLAEAVIAGAERLRGPPRGLLSPSVVSPCPLLTYKGWKAERTPPTGQQLLLMNDGHYQETEMVDDLLRAGFAIGDRQKTLHIGGVMEGHIDGLILVNDKWHLLECKAMSMSRYTEFRQRGFAAELGIEVQVQLYLHSDELSKMELGGGFVYSKHKDSCRPYDLFFEYKPQFAESLVEQVRRLQDGWIPEPVKCPLCSTCRFRVDCWKAELIDFSGVKTVSLPELVEQWKRGTNFRRYGKELVDEARNVFEKELGDLTVITIDDLKILRVMATRGGISEQKFIEVFGSENLPKVWEEKRIPQMRVTEIDI